MDQYYTCLENIDSRYNFEKKNDRDITDTYIPNIYFFSKHITNHVLI